MARHDREKPRRRVARAIFSIILTLVLCAAFFVAGMYVEHNGLLFPESEPVISIVDLTQQLSEVNELSTVEYTYTNMGQFEQSNDFYGVTIPFTTKSFIISYDGIIKAGVDLGKAVISLEETVVTVTLPDAEIFSHEIDEDSLQILDETSGLFNKLTLEDYSSFRIDQKAAMETKALSGGLLSTAREKAESAVSSTLLSALPEGYTVVFA